MKGFAAFGVCFALLAQVWVNHQKRDGLELNALERLKTKQSLTDHIAMSLVGLVSVSLALLLPPRWVAAAGYFYFFVGVYFTISGAMFGRQGRRLKGSLTAAAADGT